MKIISKFLDKEEWSLYASLQTVVILLCLKLGMNINNLQTLIFASILAFMSGELVPKLIYTFFICMMLWGNLKKDIFIKYTFVSLLSIVITSFIKKDNIVYRKFYSGILRYFLIVCIGLWMIYIPYLLYMNAE